MSENNEEKTFLGHITWKEIVVGLVLLGLVALVFFIQVNNATVATPTETALFGILQFIFSLAFAWFITKIQAKHDFNESQEKYGLSAVRRIEEIKDGVESLVNATRDHSKVDGNEELKLIGIIGDNILNTINSSIADWGNIMGETIRKTQKYDEESKIVKDLNEKLERLRKDNLDSDESMIKLDKELKEQQKKVKDLFESLPKSIQVEKELNKSSRMDDVRETAKRIESEIDSEGYLSLAFRVIPESNLIPTIGQKLRIQYSMIFGLNRFVAMLGNQMIGTNYPNTFLMRNPNFQMGLLRLLGDDEREGTIFKLEDSGLGESTERFIVKVKIHTVVFGKENLHG